MADGVDSFAERVFAPVAARVLETYPGDAPGRMLRSPGLRTSGGFFAFATATDLVVKLPAPRVGELVASGRGLPCSPRPDRPMKEWVRIPGPDSSACLSYVLEARAFVSAAATGRRDSP